MRVLGIGLIIILYALQGFSYILGVYALGKIKLKSREFIIAGVIISIVFYIMRLLPVSFGIHTILNSICIFFVGIFFLKMPPLSVIKAQLIITVFLLVAEFANVFILTNFIGKEKFDLLMEEVLYKYILGLPSSVIFALANFILYNLLVIRNRKSLAYGETSA